MSELIATALLLVLAAAVLTVLCTAVLYAVALWRAGRRERRRTHGDNAA